MIPRPLRLDLDLNLADPAPLLRLQDLGRRLSVHLPQDRFLSSLARFLGSLLVHAPSHHPFVFRYQRLRSGVPDQRGDPLSFSGWIAVQARAPFKTQPWFKLIQVDFFPPNEMLLAGILALVFASLAWAQSNGK